MMPVTAAPSSNSTVLTVGSLLWRTLRSVVTISSARPFGAACMYARTKDVLSATSAMPRITYETAMLDRASSSPVSTTCSPWYTENEAPATKMNIAAMNAQKNRSLP